MSRIYIILPVHNRCELTREFITSLARQTCQDYHLVVIDDGSTDGTSTMVATVCPEATVLKGDGTWWWAGSLQQGYNWLAASAAAPDDIVLLINDDTQFGPDFLKNAVELLKQNMNSLLIAKCYGINSRRIQDSGVLVNWRRLWLPQAKAHEEADCYSTRGLFLKVADFAKIGGFHPWLLPHYLSDYEFTLRAGKKGYRFISHDSLIVYSIENDTRQVNYAVGSFGLFLREYFSTKSRVNPFMWSSFVILSAPWQWKPYCLMVVWISAFLNICRYFVHGQRQ